MSLLRQKTGFQAKACPHNHRKTWSHTHTKQRLLRDPAAKCSIYLCLTPFIELPENTQHKHLTLHNHTHTHTCRHIHGCFDSVMPQSAFFNRFLSPGSNLHSIPHLDGWGRCGCVSSSSIHPSLVRFDLSLPMVAVCTVCERIQAVWVNLTFMSANIYF